MITIGLIGGLGNQLFQIFASIAYGMEHDVSVIFPFTDRLNDRVTYWETFLKHLKKYTNDGIYQLNNEVLATSAMFTTYQEPEFRYHPIPFINSNRHIRAIGYFQSYKYFEKYQKAIFNEIQLKEQQDEIRREYGDLLQGECASIHFRLGDYKTKQEYHPIMPYSYYHKAISRVIQERGKNLRFLYFCEAEDNAYVGEIIKQLNINLLGGVGDFIKVDDRIDDWKQLLIMSCCDHNIIANSSFSWFGGYFNRRTDKIVVYPNRWFGPALHWHDVRDMFPAFWVKVDI